MTAPEPGARWHPRTLLDARREQQAGTAADPSAVRAPMRCRCRRLVPPEMLRDVTMLPAALRADLPADVTHLCDACEEERYAHGQWDRAAVAEARGAPAAHVAALRSAAAAHAAARAAHEATLARIQQEHAALAPDRPGQ